MGTLGVFKDSLTARCGSGALGGLASLAPASRERDLFLLGRHWAGSPRPSRWRLRTLFLWRLSRRVCPAVTPGLAHSSAFAGLGPRSPPCPERGSKPLCLRDSSRSPATALSPPCRPLDAAQGGDVGPGSCRASGSSLHGEKWRVTVRGRAESAVPTQLPSYLGPWSSQQGH